MGDIAVLGAGYVGLTTAICLASLEHSVIVSDINEERIVNLGSGKCPIFEESLEELLNQCLESSRIRFTSNNCEAVSDADFVFLCLPTPQGEFGEADMQHVFRVIDEIRTTLRSGAIVITKSTVPIGASAEVSSRIGRNDVFYVSNPEFLREGTAVYDFLNPDRIVIGSTSEDAASRVGMLYSRVSAPIIYTDPISAETIKYASNSFLATKLSFVNGLASVCEAVGANAGEVLRGMGMDSRIGGSYLRPGPGWGGSCFPKDTRALLATSDMKGFDFDLLRSVIVANDRHINRIAEKLDSLVDRGAVERHIAILGLTFKAGTDDLRDSPAVAIAVRLTQLGNNVSAFDPAVSDLRSLRLASEIQLRSSPEEAVRGASLVAILTEWPEFQHLDPNSIGAVMNRRVVFDSRLILAQWEWESAGFTYFGVGK